MLKYSIAFLLMGTSFCIAQQHEDYEEYRPEPRNYNAGNRFQFEQESKTTTTQAPIAILKQINKHNEDGSYTYGYEGADGSFKIETKAADGEVKGKYGYFDGERIRVVEYGANKFGFQPSGDGITVPPPVFHEDRVQQQFDYEDDEAPRQVTAPKPKYSNQQQQYQQPRPQPNYAPLPSQAAEKRRPIAQAPQQQQYYDYEDEIVQTTPKPVQLPPRPKFNQQPKYTSISAAAPPRPQFSNAIPIDIVYADTRRPAPQQQSNSFENRQPAQFPQQDPPADHFSLFAPAGNSNSRADIFSKQKITKQPQAPQLQAFQFAPQQQSPPPPPSQPIYSPKPSQNRGTSILDQLAKDFALPQSSNPLHDISFGYSLQ